MVSSSRPSWDETWFEVARVMSRRTRCSRAQVGAVIVDTKNRIVATGYNGPPANWPHANGACDIWCPRAMEGTKSVKYKLECPSVHGEVNALNFADRRQIEGGTLYVTVPPCPDCAKIVSNSGVARVVTEVVDERDRHRNPWGAIGFMQACGLKVVIIRM